MSRIYFNGKGDTAEVYGSERAYAEMLIDDIAYSSLRWLIKNPQSIYDNFILDDFLTKECAKKKPNEDFDREEEYFLKLAIQRDWGDKIRIKDEVISKYKNQDTYINSTDWMLNHALRLGSDLIKFLCKVHGQCEIHGYIKKENYEWLAEIIAEGLRINVLRDEIKYKDNSESIEWKSFKIGWENVIKLLRTSESDIIVMSYSVTEDFPNAFYHDGTQEEFEQFSFEKQWDIASKKLIEDQSLELDPKDWNTFWFEG